MVFIPPAYVASTSAMWVMGGFTGAHLNDVWYSTDGKDWTQQTANAQWGARSEHTTLVFNNTSGGGQAMWVIGGDDGTGASSEGWYATDGIDWTQCTDKSKGEARMRKGGVGGNKHVMRPPVR